MNKTRLMAIAGSLALVVGLVLGYLFSGGEKAATGTGARDTGRAVGAETTSERREVVLSIPDMTCPMCPTTVHKALTAVDGVAEASLDDKQARVVFDPARTSIDSLITAVAEAGFHATLQESGDG